MKSRKDQAEKLKVRLWVIQNQGNQAVLVDDYDKAIGLYNRAIEIDPDNAIYYNNRSAAYFRKGSFQQALLDAEKALQLDANLTKAHIKKVEALMELQQFQVTHLLTQEAGKALETAFQVEKCSELEALAEALREEINNVQCV